jgi:hypothetical protein
MTPEAGDKRNPSKKGKFVDTNPTLFGEPAGGSRKKAGKVYKNLPLTRIPGQTWTPESRKTYGFKIPSGFKTGPSGSGPKPKLHRKAIELARTPTSSAKLTRYSLTTAPKASEHRVLIPRDIENALAIKMLLLPMHAVCGSKIAESRPRNNMQVP